MAAGRSGLGRRREQRFCSGSASGGVFDGHVSGFQGATPWRLPRSCLPAPSYGVLALICHKYYCVHDVVFGNIARKYFQRHVIYRQNYANIFYVNVSLLPITVGIFTG